MKSFLILFVVLLGVLGDVTLIYWSDNQCTNSIGKYTFNDKCTGNYDGSYVKASGCDDIKYYSDDKCDILSESTKFSSDCKAFGTFYVTCSSWNDSATALFSLGGTFMAIGFFGAICCLWICCCPLGILFILIGLCVAYS